MQRTPSAPTVAACAVCGGEHVVLPADDVTAGGVEHDLAAHAVQHFFVAVLMPPVGIAGAVAPPVRAQALGTHPGCDLVFAWRRAVMPLDRGVGAPSTHHSRECSVPPRRRGDGSRGLRRPGEEDHRSFVTESNSALRVQAQVPAAMYVQRLPMDYG